MNARSRWMLWGALGVVGVLIVAGVVTLGVVGRREIPSDAVFVPRDVPTLQEALDRATPGTTIAIQPSADPVEGPVEILTSDLVLMATRGRVSVRATGATPAITIAASGVTVSNLNVSSESTGIQVNATDCTLEDVTIDAAQIGIQLSDASRCAVQSIEVQGSEIGLDIVDSGRVMVQYAEIAGASQYGVRLRNSRNASLQGLNTSGCGVGLSFENGSNSNSVQGGEIELCTETGIEIRASNDNTMRGVAIKDSPVGIALEGVTGNEVHDCQILGTDTAGILLRQAVQNRVVETDIENASGNGVDLSQSAENAILYNSIRDCAGTAIQLARSDNNLILGNEVNRGAMGITLTDCSGVSILRNNVQKAQLSGVIVSNGGSNRLLDNVMEGPAFGMVVTGTRKAVLLRNSVAHAAEIGIALFDSAGANHISDNNVQSCDRGLLLAGSVKDDITHNQLSENEVGALVSVSESGTRFEGNTISGNRIGLKQEAGLLDLETQWSKLALTPPQSGGTAVPVLANNVFKDNSEYDIVNETTIQLLAAGNRWGASATRDASMAIVSGSVSLETSAWKGTIAVGADSDEVRTILGRILEQRLADAGFHVIDLVGIGSSARLQQALSDSDVDLIWWTGPDSSAQALGSAAPPDVLDTPAVEGWEVIVSSALASQLEPMTTSALASWWSQNGDRLRFAATSDLSRAAFDSFVDAYGLSDAVRSFTQADDLKQVEALLKLGTVDVVLVRNLKETLTLAGFQAIDDDLQVFSTEPLSVVVQATTLEKYPVIKPLLEDLASRMTTDVIHDLVSRVRLLNKSSEDVAREFLESTQAIGNE